MQSKVDKKTFQFIPSKEFIESGNFKYNTKTDLENPENKLDLSKSKVQFYYNLEANLPADAEIDKVPIVQMSASSIAQVCGIPRSQVLEILKEIFAKVVELSKVSKEEIILDLRYNL